MTSAQTKPRLALGQATRGIIRGEPLRLLVHGVEGVGKSTFGANAPKALFLGAEDGSAEIAVEGRLAPANWEEAVGVVRQLETEDHAYKTLVVDSLDWLEPLCWQYTCEKHSKATLESFGFGKGFAAALDEWRVFIDALKSMQTTRKVAVILIAHSISKTFKNPDGNQGDYDRYTLKLNDKAAGLFKEWAKAVLFMNYERATVEKDNRTKGLDTGKRKIYSRMTAAYDAKNRLWLPAEFPLSWQEFSRLAKAGEELRMQWDDMLRRVDEGTRGEMQLWIEQQNYDPAAVAKTLEQMKAQQNNQAK